MIELSIPQIIVPGGYSQERQSFKWGEQFSLIAMEGGYGNLFLKNFDYGQRHDYINTLLKEIFYLHELERKRINDDENVFNVHSYHSIIKHQTETVIYFLRKTMDDLVGITYITYQIYVSKGSIDKVEMDSISRISYCKDQDFKAFFDKYTDFFKKILDVSNSYKHSFMQYESSNLIGVDEPTVVALYLKDNNLKNQPQYFSFSLRTLVEQYTNFFVDMLNQNKRMTAIK